MGTSLLASFSLLELLIKGEYSLSKDSIVNCQEIKCFLLLPAVWVIHKLFSPPQHSSTSAQHLALLPLLRCLQLLFLLAFFSDTFLPLPQIPHRQSACCSEHYTSPQEPRCIFPQWRKSFQIVKRRAELPSSPAAASGEGGRLPNNLCSFGIQMPSLWWREFTTSWQQFQTWPFAPHSSAKEGCWQGPWLCEGEEWEPTGSTIP